MAQQAPCAERAALNCAMAPGSATAAVRLPADRGGGVQAGDRVVRRCGGFHGDRLGGRRGAVARDDGRRLRPRGSDYPALSAARSISSPATASWRCSGHQWRWRIMLFGPVWRPWTSKSRSHQLADEVQRRDGVALRLRVGLNSGRVIAGEIGSGATGYTAIGEQVVLAQRMESVAPPGGVMLERVHRATRRTRHRAGGTRDGCTSRAPRSRYPRVGCWRAAAERRRIGRREPTLVGRTWEMNTVAGILDQAINGAGCVVGVVGPRRHRQEPHRARGRDAGHRSRGRGVHSTSCESHTREVPFHVVARLLRTVFGVSDLDEHAGRAQVRARDPRRQPRGSAAARRPARNRRPRRRHCPPSPPMPAGAGWRPC